jgi:hypothetical protein
MRIEYHFFAPPPHGHSRLSSGSLCLIILCALGDLAELDYAAFVFDQSVHGRIWLLRADNVLQSNDALLLPCWTRCVILYIRAS